MIGGEGLYTGELREQRCIHVLSKKYANARGPSDFGKSKHRGFGQTIRCCGTIAL